ncbi:MAG: calcium/sodium antiporter [Flavobacteriaceae bacterium]|nr:calcium/sodium antiporter [Flavobacteriaceae bacterium]
MDIVFILSGLVLLVVGGEFLVRSSVAISLKFHLSKMIIGLTVVSFATSAPELFVSVQAAFDGYPYIALGNVIGSNIANIGLVLGVTTIISPLFLDRDFYKFNWPVMMLLSVGLYFLLLFGDGINRIEGIGLLLVLTVYLWVLIRKAQKNRKIIKSNNNPEISEIITSNFKIAIWLVIGGGALWGGSELLVKGAVNIAENFGVSNRIIAITMIAIGTSVPELAASVVAALKGEKALLIGNIIGSNIFNIASVIGITAFIHPISVLDSGISLVLNDVLWMIGFAAAILVLAFLPKKFVLTRYKGIILFVAYAIFMGLVFLNYN